MNASQRRVRVLIVDDSALVRQVLTDILTSDGRIEVVGVAADPYVAREKIKQLDPDVITLDVEMPRMDGITFLSNLMRLRPMPVVMVSSLTQPGADVTLSALELGAVDFISKPKLDVARGLGGYAEELVAKVRMAATARVRTASARSGPSASAAVQAAPLVMARVRTTDRLLAIGASTGGTEAIREVLAQLPPDGPPTLITQHIPEAFSAAFADRLDRASAMRVSQAVHGEQILPGHAYVAPGNQHLRVKRSGARFICRLDGGEPVNRHRPSVDVLFESVAHEIGINAIGVLLTGMGADGADGLKRLRDAGAPTIAQDEATSVVWGMPGEAVKRGGADEVLPLGRIAARVMELSEG